MVRLDSYFHDIAHLDTLSQDDTVFKRFDPRMFTLITFLYIITVVSFDKYEISSLLMLSWYPCLLFLSSSISFKLIGKTLIIATPFVLSIVVWNPFLDTKEIIFFSVTVSQGWFSFLSIVIRCVLTISTVIIFLSIIGFSHLCRALERLAVPSVLTTQLYLLFRFIFIIGDELVRMNRARLLRSGNMKKMSFAVYRSLLGYLLIRTINRSDRIYQAMQCRGFTGKFPLLEEMVLTYKDVLFFLICFFIFLILRLYDVPTIIGFIVMEWFV